ncbi:glycosyltransferase family 32 protein [Veillonella criceti]|uniref:Mannosyltransferase OCH1 and related enzymes n=1 Tax=Veillonella criceti TaxID=103891 RepID=A0A380NBT6_9FIRM|nr:glycosyltransferase [Veillonella criceti]SUP37230.1 Mannosyltransferase OCH1 and related enzymes [Veillonella criceti]
MIPKIIHYCWFGGKPLPKKYKKYIETWKKYCPDYEIIEWNENNFDINQNRFCKEAYEAKKWAFVADYVRLKVLCEYGGIYLDTDIEVCKSFDKILGYDAFVGFESSDCISTATIGSEKSGEWITYLLSYYDDKSFFEVDGGVKLITNVIIITKMTKARYNIIFNNKFQIFGENNALFPFEVFCAKEFGTGRNRKTDNTYTVHHFSGSWLTPYGKYKQISHQIRHRVKNTIKSYFKNLKS